MISGDDDLLDGADHGIEWQGLRQVCVSLHFRWEALDHLRFGLRLIESLEEAAG